MANVSFYNSFFTSDPYNDWYVNVLLATDAYTFDATHVLSDVAAFECTDSGYARSDNFVLNNDGTGTDDVASYVLNRDGGGSVAFAAMTVANYRYAVILDSIGNPISCVDAGSAQSLTDEILTLSGVVFTIGAA